MPINLQCFVVRKIIFSFNRKLMLFIELRVQVVTINALEKTDRNIITRMDEHATKTDPPLYQHLTSCAQCAEYLKFYALPDIDAVNRCY